MGVRIEMHGEKVLLHACCGPCSTQVWQLLRQEFQKVDAFFYNPNIQPEEEYRHRLEAMFSVAERLNAHLIHDDSGQTEWMSVTSPFSEAPEGGERCAACFRHRLRKTCETARKLGYQYITTTLTVSRHKRSQTIIHIGRELSREYGIHFLDRDFKKKDGSLHSDRLAREWNLYRQNYCGCLYSRK